MSNVIKTTIVLGAFCLIVFTLFAFFSFYYLPRNEKAIEKKMAQLDTKLQNTPNLLNEFTLVTAQLSDVEKKWSMRSKDIPLDESTPQTYNYINHLIDLSGYVKIDLVFIGTQKSTNYGYSTYSIKGEGPFQNVYKLIWYVENGRRLYKIRNLSIKGEVIKPKSDEEPQYPVLYEFLLDAYFSSIPELSASTGIRDTFAPAASANPFLPAIVEDLPPNVKNLVEVERSDLKAVIQGKAFVVDQSGTLRILMEGDEVYLGYVTKILPEQGRVECTLNKGGFSEKVELNVRHELPTTK